MSSTAAGMQSPLPTRQSRSPISGQQSMAICEVAQKVDPEGDYNDVLARAYDLGFVNNSDGY
ncbi:hypothetical protein GCM10025777_46100 [Membranihabitans marinus]